MKLNSSSYYRWRLLIFYFVMMAFVLGNLNIVSAAKKKEEEKKESPQYIVTGRDPKAFADASEMLAVPDQRFLEDQTANMILDSLETAIRKRDKWSSAIWSQLDRLRSVRISATRVQLLQNVAQMMSVKETQLRRDKLAAARRAFEQGNRYYEAGKLDQAIEAYRSALNEHPTHWDAWNNMALAEIHRNNDIVALFLLSALTKSNPRYSGVSINLSVCLERLGQDAAAYKVAADLASEQTQMPMAQYNMAWFENSQAKYDKASGYIVKALATVDNYSVAKWLKTINTMESGDNVTYEDMKSLPNTDQDQGTPKIITRQVKVLKANAYSGNSVVAQIPKNSHLVISEKKGDSLAFYWPVDNVKRRLWIHTSLLGDDEVIGHVDAPASDITGTTWIAKDSNGDEYTFTFKPGGRLAYKSPSGSYDDADDTWKQQGNSIRMSFSDGYMIREGTISGTRMEGRYWNKAGKKGTWSATRQ